MPGDGKSTLEVGPTAWLRRHVVGLTAWLRRCARLTPADDRYQPTLRWARRAIAVLLVLGVGGFLIDGVSRVRRPHLVPVQTGPGPAPAAASRGLGVQGWGSLQAAVLSVGDHHACVVDALTTSEQETGLMGRTTLAPYAGMAFVFATPTTDGFWMKDTLIPLSLAWFGSDGRFLASVDMTPCPLGAACRTYAAPAPYTLAIEVPEGSLTRMGIGPGATAHLAGPGSC